MRSAPCATQDCEVFSKESVLPGGDPLASILFPHVQPSLCKAEIRGPDTEALAVIASSLSVVHTHAASWGEASSSY